eukprot:204060_1
MIKTAHAPHTDMDMRARSKRTPHAQPVKNFSSGMHTFLVSGTQFIVDLHFSPIKPIGTGAYGVVCAAYDNALGEKKKVAIKKITNAFDDLVDAKRILREIKMLAHFDHENIVGLLDMIPPVSTKRFEDVYMVLGYMETDLHKIIYSKNELTDEHCQYFIYQILRGIKYIHAAGVIHRDLKPSNLLLNGNCDLKICDMGLARGVENSVDFELTEYVVTRWYRAPEIMCSCQDYDYLIDVWSIGCILGELLGRKPLFPGENYIHQLNLIFDVLGTPDPSDMTWITNEKALIYIKNLPKKQKVPFRVLFPKASPLCLDLLDKMLVFNPGKRYSIDDCVKHKYLEKLHNPADEPLCATNFNFDFEQEAGTDEGIRRLMLQEVLKIREQRNQELSRLATAQYENHPRN